MKKVWPSKVNASTDLQQQGQYQNAAKAWHTDNINTTLDTL